MTPERLEYLEQQLRSYALNERIAALDELAKAPSDIAVPVLQKLALEPDFLFRRLGVMGLGNHPTPASLATLKQILADEQDANVVAEIANSLFEFGDVGIELLPGLFAESTDWLVRQTILGILADADRPTILLSVIKLGLADETVTTKETAILALAQLVNGEYQLEATGLLLDLAQSSQWRDRWRAATTLCVAEDSRARDALAILRQDENHYVVAAALESGFS
jgi:HEAT repeat protein